MNKALMTMIMSAGVISQMRATEARAQSSADAPASLEEIVVTAQKRSENLQVVPIAVTALTASQLRASGVTSTEDLGIVTPALTVVNVAGIVLPHIRGIGTTAYGAGLENSVSTYVDGVYLAAGYASLLSLNNIAQIEVLKGPQGTLFGRNATGGLIQITTKDPQPNTSGEASIGYGNYQTIEGNGYLTGAVLPSLDADIAVHALTQGQGYGTNVFNGRDVYRTDRDFAGRTKWRWSPSSDTTITYSMDYEEMAGTQNSTFRDAPGTLPLFATTRAVGAWDTDSAFQPFDSSKGGGASIRLEQSIGFAKITDIAAYRRSQDALGFDVDHEFEVIPLVQERDSQVSEEFQLSSLDSGRLQWVAGLFYLHSIGKYAPSEVLLSGPLINPFFPLDRISIYGAQVTDSYAAYGQSTFAITDADRVTLGARFTDEHKRLTASEPAELVGGIPVELINPPIDQSKTFSRPTWRMAFDHRFSSDVMGYVSYNTSFKSGGFNPGVPTDPAYKPEVLTAYEVGAKVTALDDRVRLNSAAYYYDYKDIQVAHYVLGQIGYYNGAAAKLYGVDADFAALIARGLTLTAGVAWIHDYFSDFRSAVITRPIPTGGADVTLGSAEGNHLPLTPTATFNLSVDYRHPLANGETELNVSYEHNSGYFTQPDNVMEQAAFNLVNATASWSTSGERFKVSLWGRNLTNELITNMFLPASVNTEATYRPPRTYGVQFSTKF